MRHKLQLISPKARFLTYVEMIPFHSCWEWNGPVRNHNKVKPETVFFYNNTTMSASRAAWLMFKGQLTSNAFVLRSCDNTNCVNPSHLYLGTRKDAQRKGRATPRKIKTLCKYGHKRTPFKGRYVCRECCRITAAKSYYRRMGRTT